MRSELIAGTDVFFLGHCAQVMAIRAVLRLYDDEQAGCPDDHIGFDGSEARPEPALSVGRGLEIVLFGKPARQEIPFPCPDERAEHRRRERVLDALRLGSSLVQLAVQKGVQHGS